MIYWTSAVLQPNKMKDKQPMICPAALFRQNCLCQSQRFVPHLKNVANTWLSFQITSSLQLNNDDSTDENNEYEIKIFKIIGKTILNRNCEPISFISERRIVPGIFLLFSLVYWSFSLLCYYDFIQHFLDINQGIDYYFIFYISALRVLNIICN